MTRVPCNLAALSCKISAKSKYWASAHRWRYAQTGQALEKPFASSQDGTLFVGGDWALGARVECAYESGVAMADAVLASVGQREGVA